MPGLILARHDNRKATIAMIRREIAGCAGIVYFVTLFYLDQITNETWVIWACLLGLVLGAVFCHMLITPRWPR